MGLNYLIFNGESSLDHGAYIGGQQTFNAPQRDVTKVKIPGRNGDLIRDNGRWLNIEVPYNLVIMDEFRDNAGEIRRWLTEPVGYSRLEDTYHPDYFRLARVQGTIDFETAAFNLTGKTRVVFDCKPQRFLKTGEQEIAVSSGGKIYNQTQYDSKPLIRVLGTGDGTVTIGDYVISLSGFTTEVDIDCELQDCFYDGTSQNSKVALASGFPVLKPGNNLISFTGDVSGVRITGRWFTI